MKKKIIALALAAVMVVLTLGLASCTGGDNTDPAGGRRHERRQKRHSNRRLRRRIPPDGL